MILVEVFNVQMIVQVKDLKRVFNCFIMFCKCKICTGECMKMKINPIARINVS